MISAFVHVVLLASLFGGSLGDATCEFLSSPTYTSLLTTCADQLPNSPQGQCPDACVNYVNAAIAASCTVDWQNVVGTAAPACPTAAAGNQPASGQSPPSPLPSNQSPMPINQSPSPTQTYPKTPNLPAPVQLSSSAFATQPPSPLPPPQPPKPPVLLVPYVAPAPPIVIPPITMVPIHVAPAPLPAAAPPPPAPRLLSPPALPPPPTPDITFVSSASSTWKNAALLLAPVVLQMIFWL